MSFLSKDYILHVKMNQASTSSSSSSFQEPSAYLGKKKFCLNTGGEEVLSSSSFAKKLSKGSFEKRTQVPSSPEKQDID